MINATIDTPDGACPVTLHTPNGTGPWSGVVMFPDAGGVRPTFQEMAARLAGFGHAVLLPDVYYRDGDWEPFDMGTVFTDEAARKRRLGMISSLTPEQRRGRRGRVLRLPRKPARRCAATGSASCGYCMGGRIFGDAGRAAARPHRRGRGVLPRRRPGGRRATTPARTCSPTGMTSDDLRRRRRERASPSRAEHAETLEKALTAAGVTHTVEIYPAGHGFAVPDNVPYDEEAAERHWIALQELFETALPS